ncbi:MAG TPA: TetR/AcrR family transcriptional regulator [Steroidobacteraceae bacterium]|nr:TetR/AcrR family transcriptional regulator [Steroidobacteraceae bacterium]
MRTRTTNLSPVQLRRREQIGQERRERTRVKLIQAAYRLFAVHGADAPTIDDVIAEAGVARGTFYNHFKTRDELFGAVADDIATSINAVIRPAITGIGDAATRLALAFRMFLRFALADEARGWILLRTMPLVGPLNEEMKTFVQSEFEQALATGRMRSVSAAVATDLGIGLQIMTIHRVLVDRGGEAAIDAAAEALLVALGVDAAEARKIVSRPIPRDASAAIQSPAGLPPAPRKR